VFRLPGWYQWRAMNIAARCDPHATAGGEEKIVSCEADALFVMIGADANTAWLPGELERDPKGYICTGRDLTTWKLERAPFPLETNLPGVSAPATCAIIRSNACRVEWAKAVWRSRLFTSTWLAGGSPAVRGRRLGRYALTT